MLQTVSPKIQEIIKFGKPDQRKYLCKKDIGLFARTYFPEHFVFKVPDFHVDFVDDLQALFSGLIDEAAWIAFRESAKTTWAKIGVVHAICYKERHYINWDSYDLGNSEAALFDIATTLQTNRRLIQDFGQLYWKQKTEDEMRRSEKKSVSSFITSNGVKCEAFSTQQSTRGRVWGTRRPDMFVLDDFETLKTARSYPVTHAIKKHIDELRAGLSNDGCVLYLGNYVSEDGSVAYIEQLSEQTPERFRFRNIPVADDKVIAWPDKYVRTDADAVAVNADIEDRRRHKVSLAHKRRKLTDEVFETEMMNNPGKSGDYYFDRERISELMKIARNPIREVGGLKIWSEYNSRYAFGLGADTSEGRGLDANADVIINFTRRPALVVATYENNLIGPDLFGYDVAKHGEMFGNCIVAPESNNTGYATLAALKSSDVDYPNVYKREDKTSTNKPIKTEWGLRMTEAVKHDIMSSFRTAIQDGELECWDLELLKECYHYRKQDHYASHMEEGMTRHFDKLRAAAIAWEMRKWSQPVEERDSKLKSRQPAYQP